MIAGIAVGAVVGGCIGGVISAVSQYAATGEVNLNVVAVNVLSGAISGALASTGISLVASIGVNAALGGLTYTAEQVVTGENITAGGLVGSTVAGGISGAIGGKGTNSKQLGTAWKSASKGIARETRRANMKYATKQIAKYTAQKKSVKTSAIVSGVKYVISAISNVFANWSFGF